MEKIVAMFDAPELTSRDFDKVWEGLQAAGITNPKGLISHVGFAKPEGGWVVVDVWESAEAFHEFGQTLMPILQKLGAPVPPPKVIPAHFVLVPSLEKELA